MFFCYTIFYIDSDIRYIKSIKEKNIILYPKQDEKNNSIFYFNNFKGYKSNCQWYM